jgi:hypothetical protein
MTEADEKRLAELRTGNHAPIADWSDIAFLLRLLDTERAERARLNEWADGFSDAQLKERRLCEERIREIEARATQAETALAAARERVGRLTSACEWAEHHLWKIERDHPSVTAVRLYLKDKLAALTRRRHDSD